MNFRSGTVAVWRWVCLVTLLGMTAAPRPTRAQERSADFADFARRAAAGERLSVVFFGASLTWGANATDPQLTSYRADLSHRLEQAYPQAHFTFHDGAIGGTGSQLGVFRLDRDCLRHKPDLVFLDFSANDNIYTTSPDTLGSYEAIVRRIITEAHAPVVQVIFPFKWDVAKGTTDGMLRRDAHLAIARAYHTGVGDAIELAQHRVKSADTTLGAIWPYDGVHPGDAGYILFADAAWAGLRQAIDDKRVCAAPADMLNPATYMTNRRVRISSLGAPPEGWYVSHPNLTSAFFDMLMSRWLDDETIAGAPPVAGKPSTAPLPHVAKLRVRFNGTMVMLFGESTPKSGKYRVYLDGQLIPRKDNNGKVIADTFDPGDFARKANGNVHHVQLLAQGLEPADHVLEIEAVLDETVGRELRLESICVAGGKATVSAAP